MHNVLQRVQECFAESYAELLTDGSADEAMVQQSRAHRFANRQSYCCYLCSCSAFKFSLAIG
jgi:hypothetical protein